MKILPCPKCGCLPKIEDAPSIKNYKNNIRRRFCSCPNLCSVFLPEYGLKHFIFESDSDGDSNTIFKEWNERVKYYSIKA